MWPKEVHFLDLRHSFVLISNFCRSRHNEIGTDGCNSWGSNDWNTSLFPDPEAFSKAIVGTQNPLGVPLALGLNFHDSGA